MNKFLLLSVAICYSCFTSLATDFKFNDVTYVIKADNTVGVKSVDSNATAFDIPESVADESGTNYKVTSVEEEAFKWCKATSIVLPNTVDSIKYCGIYNCSKLVSVKLPESLVYLGDYALASTAITSITIPANVKKIPNNCFFTCNSLSAVNLSEGLTSIGTSAFYKCPIESIVIPESCDSIGNKAFLFCSKLTSATLPSSLVYFGYGIFNGCKALSSIVLPEGIETIGDESFLDCTALATINIPASVKSIGNGAFARSGITAFSVSDGSSYLKAINGVVYSADKKLLYAYPSKGAASYSVEKGCIGISGGAFWGADITDVTIPDGMKAFDSFVFCESQLAKINFPSSLIFMGEQALAGTQLTSCVLPENLTYVSDGLLAWSKKLTSITIPSSVTSIENHAFQTCSALTTIHCLGVTPPEIEDYYDEEDNPFGYITRDNVALSVPSGYADTYKSTVWGDLFKSISGDEVAPFVYSKVEPESKTAFKTLSGIDITFPSAVTILKSSPDIEVRQDDILSGSIITRDGWMAVSNSSDKMTVKVFPCDYDYYTDPISLESDKVYYVTIPAGIFKSANGDLNDKIVLCYYGESSSVKSITSNSVLVLKSGNEINVTAPQDADVSVYTTSGALVNSAIGTVNGASFSIDNHGIYIVKVISEGKSQSFKIAM